MQQRVENVTSIVRNISHTIVTAPYELSRFLFGRNYTEDALFTEEQEYSPYTFLQLQNDIISSYARHGKIVLVDKISQIFKITPSSEMIEQLLNNIKDYTADNVVALHNLLNLQYLENNNIPLKISSHIQNEIIPRMDKNEIEKLKDKDLICYSETITQRESSFSPIDIHEVSVLAGETYHEFILIPSDGEAL